LTISGIVASHQGAPENPAWYHNLKANPRTDVEAGAETFPVMVNETTGEERDAVWAGILAMAPSLAEFHA
jgi:deazaflavin-dependent oxidoreductase (nitroreductase family)